MRKQIFSGSTSVLRNPERGFRFEIGVGKIESDLVKFGHVTDHWPFERFPYVSMYTKKTAQVLISQQQKIPLK